MNPAPASTPGPSLSALRRAELTAERVRGTRPSPVAGSRGLFAVPELGEAHPTPSFLRGRPVDPVADTARAGGRLDTQGRLTCKKLLASLGWEPHVELDAHFRLDQPIVLIRDHVGHGVGVTGDACDCGRCVADTRQARTLSDDWIKTAEAVEITGKWELSLRPGLCHAAGLSVPGEVVAFALPALDGLLLTSTAHAVAALLDDVPLPTSLPTPAPTDEGTRT